MTSKRRYTAEEITEVLEQIRSDRANAHTRMNTIAKHIESISGMDARVEDNEMFHSSAHIPYFYIDLPRSQYDGKSAWLKKQLENPCKPPVSGIHIHTEGFMWSGDVPGLGFVENVYVSSSEYDAHASGW